MIFFPKNKQAVVILKTFLQRFRFFNDIFINPLVKINKAIDCRFSAINGKSRFFLFNSIRPYLSKLSQSGGLCTSTVTIFRQQCVFHMFHIGEQKRLNLFIVFLPLVGFTKNLLGGNMYDTHSILLRREST